MESPPDHIFRSKLPDIDISHHLSLPQYCFEHVTEFADRPCLVQSNGKNYTFAEVEIFSRRIATGFTQLGIEKGDVVMLLLPNCVEFVLLFLGLAIRGAAATTCNPFYTAQEIAKQVNGSRAKLIITQAAFSEKLTEVADATYHSFEVMTTDNEAHPKYLHFSLLTEADESKCPHVDIHPDDVVALPYSSGTTGLPKGVMLTHKSLIASIAQQVDGENPNIYMTPDDVVLCVLPMFHIYSLNTVLLCSLRIGASIVVMTKFEIVALLEVIQRFKVTIAPLVPPIVLALAKNPVVEKYDLSSVRMLMSGAAPLGKDLEASFQARVPQAVIGQGYGMTEAGPVLAMCLAFAKEPFAVKAGACGTVVRNAEVKIIDPETGASLSYNEPGEICIRGAQIMKGYVGDPEATANTIDKEGFLHTGDIGLIDDDEEIFIVDRVKEIIKFKGFQVPPAELEAILLSHTAIVDAACVPKKDEAAGEVPVAFVVRAHNADISATSIREFVAKQVSTSLSMSNLKTMMMWLVVDGGTRLLKPVCDSPVYTFLCSCNKVSSCNFCWGLQRSLGKFYKLWLKWRSYL